LLGNVFAARQMAALFVQILQLGRPERDGDWHGAWFRWLHWLGIVSQLRTRRKKIFGHGMTDGCLAMTMPFVAENPRLAPVGSRLATFANPFF
jgi:hypothetical protein